jgi:methyl-accepting chemotaxis protein I, serine sensor receptor
VEEATAASQSMQEQAASLAQLVSVFKLEAGHAPTLSAVPGGARNVGGAATVAASAGRQRLARRAG